MGWTMGPGPGGGAVSQTMEPGSWVGPWSRAHGAETMGPRPWGRGHGAGAHGKHCWKIAPRQMDTQGSGDRWTDLNNVGPWPPAGGCPGCLKAPRASTLVKSGPTAGLRPLADHSQDIGCVSGQESCNISCNIVPSVLSYTGQQAWNRPCRTHNQDLEAKDGTVDSPRATSRGCTKVVPSLFGCMGTSSMLLSNS